MIAGRYYDDEEDDDVYATRESRNGGTRGDRGAIGQSSRSGSDPMEATRWDCAEHRHLCTQYCSSWWQSWRAAAFAADRVLPVDLWLTTFLLQGAH